MVNFQETDGEDLHRRLHEINNDEDIRGWAAAVCRVLVRVVDTETALPPLDYDDCRALGWLCELVEIDNGLLWNGSWHNGEARESQPPVPNRSAEE